MANQRKKGIERVTLTLPDELLQQIQSEAQRLGRDRLSLMREILAEHLATKVAANEATPKKKGK